MSKKFFCANCGQIGHILEVSMTNKGLMFKEHKLGKETMCDDFTIDTNDLPDFTSLLDSKPKAQPQTKVTVKTDEKSSDKRMKI